MIMLDFEIPESEHIPTSSGKEMSNSITPFKLSFL